VPALTDLSDARESLAYWERRAHRLPRLAVRRRREARAMAMRWRARVADAERAAYGRGLAGAVLQLAFERRLPESTRRTGRLVARRALQAAAVVAFTLVACLAAVAALVIDLVA
jgi:hypothetical protein